MIADAGIEMKINPEDRVLTKEEVISGLRGKDGLLSLLTDPIGAEIMDASDKLRVIANYAVGYNNIDVAAATARGIPVTNTPGVLTDTVADFTIALILAVIKRVVEADAFTREGKYRGWGPMLMLGDDLWGSTLGIVGYGRIGEAVAKRVRGFDARILYYDVRRRDPAYEREMGIEYVPFDELLRRSDIVTIHTALTPETHHLIGEPELRLMAEHKGYLINTSRGPVVSEKALVRALKGGWIAGAGLDVYENEPDIRPELIDMPNVVLQPHTASASLRTRTKMATMAAENLIAGLRGERPPNCVNPEVFSSR